MRKNSFFFHETIVIPLKTENRRWLIANFWNEIMVKLVMNIDQVISKKSPLKISPFFVCEGDFYVTFIYYLNSEHHTFLMKFVVVIFDVMLR